MYLLPSLSDSISKVGGFRFMFESKWQESACVKNTSVKTAACVCFEREKVLLSLSQRTFPLSSYLILNPCSLIG